MALAMALGVAVCAGSCRLVRRVACNALGCVESIDPQSVRNAFEEAVGFLGRRRLTSESGLAGSCVRDGDYTGSYRLHGERLTCREVVFGGASFKTRTLEISASIKAGSGKAGIYVLDGAEAEEYTESFEMTGSFESGGCYIVVCCENFTGDITLTSRLAAE